MILQILAKLTEVWGRGYKKVQDQSGAIRYWIVVQMSVRCSSDVRQMSFRCPSDVRQISVRCPSDIRQMSVRYPSDVRQMSYLAVA
ncbi:hypothetical protein Btru_038224 [Bulinus truncatus]|nr:hypothetical protein Btru_038224 [Bulinus truncatus]